MEKNNLKIATFGAGCFWGVEDAFRKVSGVVDAESGFMGGAIKNPSYEDVCSGMTGHAEVVRVKYDPVNVSYMKLLDIFWKIHNSAQIGGQGPDIGSQYRSSIFYYDDDQKEEAEKSKEIENKSGKYKNDIVMEIVPASDFHKAEEYHQRYFEKNGQAGCHI